MSGILRELDESSSFSDSDTEEHMPMNHQVCSLTIEVPKATKKGRAKKSDRLRKKADSKKTNILVNVDIKSFNSTLILHSPV